MQYKDIFENKVVLITGGTGFLGRALIRRILQYNPKSIRVFSRDEVKHYKVLEKFKNHEKLRTLIGDVRDYKRLVRAMENADIVIHAAALKRIDILEYNVSESINTNILGTLNVVHACLENNVEKAVFVSTDKACSPVNTYGACKFVGEKIFVESNYSKGKKRTSFCCVRYGNVLESTGSVIPCFEEKILSNEKIPLTDSRMTRFIISHNEAVDLIFKALRHSIGGEIFVPKLPSFKIVDLIQILKEKHHAHNEIEVIGIRPGEKIHELMVNQTEMLRAYDFEDMYVIKPSLIQKHAEDLKSELSYLENSKLINQEMGEYSSRDSLISKEEIQQLFKQFNLL